MDPCFETATRLARAIRNGQLSSREATEAHLERIARLNESINALVVVDREGALKAARAADRAAAKKGAEARPAAWRADHHQGGLRCRGSCHDLEPSAAQGQCRQRADATLVARLRAAGAVILGKTNVPELCADFQTDSPLFGTTKNPWDAGARRRRLDRRRRRRGGRAPVAARDRQRHRRLGAQPRALQRHLLAEADRMARAGPRPCAGPAGHDADGALHGRVRPAGALGRGSRDGAAHHRRARRLRGRGAAGAARTDRPSSRPPISASRCSRATRW